MEVVVPKAEQQAQALATAKALRQELERSIGSSKGESERAKG